MPVHEPARRPLSILHLTSLTRRNGTVHMAARLCRLQAAAGERVFVGARSGAKILEWTEGAGVGTLAGLALRHGFYPLSFARDVRRLRRFVREQDIDLVHTWQSAETWIALHALLGSRARLVVTRAIVRPVRRTLGKPLLHARLAALFVTCGRIEQAVLAAGAPRAKVFRLADGVDQTRFRPGRDEAGLRARLGIAPTAIVAANVGRLEPVKGQSVFLRALARCPANVVGVIAGEGSLRAALQSEAEALGLRARVHFLGVRKDVEAVLAAADAYVLASLGSEGSSRATLEAMATGLPVIASDVGMLPDLVQPGETGLLVPPGDAEALARGLTELAADARLRARLGAAGLALVRARHTEEAMLASVLRVYERVVAPRAWQPRALLER